jgi:hypothetical protein
MYRTQDPINMVGHDRTYFSIFLASTKAMSLENFVSKALTTGRETYEACAFNSWWLVYCLGLVFWVRWKMISWYFFGISLVYS